MPKADLRNAEPGITSPVPGHEADQDTEPTERNDGQDHEGRRPQEEGEEVAPGAGLALGVAAVYLWGHVAWDHMLSRASTGGAASGPE